jgi:hypothetical protein
VPDPLLHTVIKHCDNDGNGVDGRMELKIPVLAPMPRAMVRIATAPKPGFLHNMRKL